MLFSGLLNPEAWIVLWIGGSGSLNCIMDFWIRNCVFVLWISESGMVFLCYGFLNLEWVFLCYGFLNLEWFFCVMDSWIQNGFFELWIGGSGMIFLTYGFMDPKCNDLVFFVEAWTVVKKLNKKYMMGLMCGMMMNV